MRNLFMLMIIGAMTVAGCKGTEDEAKMVAEVETAAERFRQTMVEPDESLFYELTSPQLTYGHSSGLIEDRETCIASMVTGKYKFLSLELSEQTVAVSGQTAIVRHRFFAHTHDEGKEPGTVTLHVLQVWQKGNEGWQLLARQAVRL